MAAEFVGGFLDGVGEDVRNFLAARRGGIFGFDGHAIGSDAETDKATDEADESKAITAVDFW